MALEFVINDVTYSFKFGFAFLREINPLHVNKVDGMDEVEEVGFNFEALKWLSTHDYTTFVNILWIANKDQKPRIDRKVLEEWIEEMTAEELEAIENAVKDFLSVVVWTSKKMMEVEEAMKVIEDQRQERTKTNNE